MKKSYLLLSAFSLLTTWCLGQQPVLQVQPCATTSNPITITDITIAAPNGSPFGWNTPDLNNYLNAISGQAIYVDDMLGNPQDGCEQIWNNVSGKIAFIKAASTYCSDFSAKAINAKNAGAIGVVFVSDIAGAPYSMPAGNNGFQINFPVIMISIDYEDLPNLHPNCTFYIGMPPPDDNDMEITKAYQGVNQRPYTQMPASQIVPNILSFNGTIKNSGLLNQSDAKLIVNYNSAIYAQSLPISSLPPTVSQDVTAGFFNPVANPGMTYDFIYEASSNEVDQNLTNNTIEGQFKVTDYILAKDKYSTNNPTTNTLNTYSEFITIFDILVEQRVYGADFKITPNASSVGQLFSYEIFDNNYISYGGGSHIISNADLSLDIITVPLSSSNGSILPIGTFYVRVQQSSNVSFQASGEADVNSVYVTNGDILSPEFTSFPINKTPIIRLNFDCQIFSNPGSFTIGDYTSYFTAYNSCGPSCNAERYIYVNGSDELRLFDDNNTLIQTFTNIIGDQFHIQNLCKANYKLVGVRSCYNLVSDTLYITVEDRITASVTGTNASTCSIGDGSATVNLFSTFSFSVAYFPSYDITISWSGLVSGSTNISGTNIFALQTKGPITIGGNLLPNSSGSFYTLTITDNIYGCVSETTFTIENDIPTQDVCVVTVDEVTGNHNVIAWERPADDSHIEEFKVYREITTGVFQAIGSVDVADLTLYEDFAANPNSTGYKYKVTLVDVCGEESDLGDFHNTIHLQYLGSGNFQWSQYAIENQSNPVASYNVYRDDNGTGNFQLLPNGVVAGTQSTFTDVNYTNFPNAVYVVDVNWISTTGCTATKANINTSRSNAKGITDGGTGSGILESLSSLVSVAPNPANSFVSIKVPQVLVGSTIRITNSLGQTFTVETINTTDLNVDLNNYDNGIYFIQIETSEGTIIKKLVKN